MDSIVEKLTEIEATAEAIVKHAEAQKPVLEQEIKARRDQFDAELEKETQQKLEAIRAKLSEETDRILDEQRERNRSFIEKLQHDFEQNHTAYAQEILAKITEV